MKTLVLGILSAATFLAMGPAQAADLEAAKKKVSELCQACHGMDGNSQVPDYPKLAGQNQDYLAKALRDYKSGARKDPTMNGFAGTLTAQDIDNLAAYYSQQPAVLQSRM
ncbi:MAG TPA: cytochrome c [Casimicrobiaceae bacterium]|jgi:cytochrome c553